MTVAMRRLPTVNLAELRYDLSHGVPRRLFNDTLDDFARSIPSGARTLEIGCGYYDHRPHFERLLRMDLYTEHEPDVNGDALAMPLAEGSVDASICISVLEHVHDPYQAVREWHRVMAPGGRVLAWIPFFFGVHGYPGDVSRFTEEGCRQLFERAGFELESTDTETYSGLFLNLGDAVHFALPRNHRSRAVRGLNKSLALAFRLGLPLDRRLRLPRLYAGTTVIARKPTSP